MKRARLSGALVLAVVAAGLTLPASSAAAAGTDLYVDNQLAGCSNNGPGTAAQPYCSLQTAVDAAQPGDTVHVQGWGQYGDVDLTHSGTPGAPITIAGAGHLTRLSVTGAHDLRLQGLSATTMQLTSAHAVTLDGFGMLAGTAATGLEIGGDSSQITVSRSFLYDAGTAVQVDPGSSDVVLTTDWISAGTLGVHVSAAAGVDLVSSTLDGGAAAAPPITVDHASTGTVIENNVFAGPITVVADSTVGAKVDYNLGYTVNGSPLYEWAGRAINDVPAFRSASGQGAHDLGAGAWTGASNPRVTNTLQIDSADALAPGELPTDARGNARVDDPLVSNSGTGVGYYDRGALEAQDPFQAESPTLSADNVAYGSTVAFTAVDDNPWGDTVSRTYDFGDGTSEATTTAPVVHHTYAAVPGGGSKRYQVTVTETSPTDGTQHSFTLWETVNPPGPLQVFYPRLGAEPSAPLNVVFAGADFHSPFTISSCTADFGDGSKPVTGSCWNLPHTYARAGLYTVRVKVTDAGGQTASIRQNISVGPQFTRTTPVTTLDTYRGTGTSRSVVGPGRTLRLKVAGVAGVPGDAAAVRLNVTAVGAGMSGSVTAYAEGRTRPGLPTVLYPARQASSSLIDVPVGAGGYVDLTNLSGRAYLSAEVEGYSTLTPGTQGLVFVPEASIGYPTQWLAVLDTTQSQHPAKIGPGGSMRFSAVPGPSAPNTTWSYATGEGSPLVELSVTTSGSTAFSRLTFQGGRGAGPGADGVYAYPGQRHTTTLLVPVAPDGTVTVRNSAGWTNVRAEVEGFYLPAASAPSTQAMVTVASTPVFDTLTGLGVRRGPITGNGAVWVKVAGVAGIPAGATAVAVRLAALNAHYSGGIVDYRSYGGALTVTAGQNIASLVYLPVVNGWIKLNIGDLSPFDLTASVEGYSAG
ncbi:PKD domain-containing protein [Streptacidiphilus pinicola]|nr:PKD domain-containing protein [Streptacidiphilus pinicola]